jgi:transcriptional regulator with XRE-family HTH domain
VTERSEADRPYLLLVSRRVRSARVLVGVNRDELARLAGLSRVTLGSIERGEHAAGLLTYVRLARALGGLDGLAAGRGAAVRGSAGVGCGPVAGETAEALFLRALGKRVRLLRLLRELSQDELGEAAGVSRSFVGLIEKGTHESTWCGSGGSARSWACHCTSW